MPLTKTPHLPRLHFTGGKVSGSLKRRHSTQPMLIAYVAMSATMARLILKFVKCSG